MDIHEFDKNRAAFPPEELLQYRGQYVAWSPDGKRIIASDTDAIRLDDTVQELGYDPSDMVFSSVPDADIILITEPVDRRDRRLEGRAILDLCQFDKNRAAFPPEQLLQYGGKHIAWSPDGKRIVASDPDLLRLDEMVKELGYDPSEVLFSWVPEEEGTLITGAWIVE
jgi:hypothetical protein